MQLTGSACNSRPLGTPQSTFIHRQHKGFHDGLLSLGLFIVCSGAGGLSHWSCLIFIAQDQTNAAHTVPLPLWESPTDHETGRWGINDVVQRLKYDDLPSTEPIREAARQPVAGRLLEVTFLCMPASSKMNAERTLSSGQILRSLSVFCKGLRGNKTHTDTAADFTELPNNKLLCVTSVQDSLSS